MGKSQIKKERLNKSISCFEIFFFRRIKILLGMLNPGSLTDVERICDVSYFLTVCGLGNYRIIALIF